MHVVLGATGHVGSAVLKKLIEAGEQVLAITHSPDHGSDLRSLGAEVALADIHDVEMLTQALMRGHSAFILNPPGQISADSVSQELNSAHAIIKAVNNSGLKKIVLESTQGAQLGRAIGDLGVLYELEQGLRNTGIPMSVTRAGFYMSNWDSQLNNARAGRIESLFPADFRMPMAAPEDLGAFNAEKMLRPLELTFELHDFSGPVDYSAQDVARAFAKALGHPVDIDVIPQNKWIEYFEEQGFSSVSAKSYAHMSEIAFYKEYQVAKHPVRGSTTIDAYIERLVLSAELQGLETEAMNPDEELNRPLQ